jgi:catalase
VSHLPNIDADLAKRVADGLGLTRIPKTAIPAREPMQNLKLSPSLSIALNPPLSFAGRKVGALVTDGVDRELLEDLKAALEAEGAALEVIAPTVGGVTAADGALVEAKHKIGGGPSVLFDAIAIMASAGGMASLLKNAAARDFVSDAFAHLKFIAYTGAAIPLFEKAGIAGDLDEGCVELSGAGAVKKFVASCHALRLWSRENIVKT